MSLSREDINDNIVIVYRHRRLDTNEIFYVGIGKTEKRAYTKSSRNKHWKNIVKKTNYEVEIIARDLSWGDACELEEFLISEYGRKDLGLGSLVNMTDGGDGIKNLSQEAKEKIRKSAIGKIISDKTKDKMSKSAKGKIISDETKKKMSDSKKGNLHPHYGKKMSDEHRRKNSEAKIGEKNPNYGKPKSIEFKEKLSKILKGRKHTEESLLKIRESAKLKRIPIIQLTKDGYFIKEWGSASEAGNILNIKSTSITQVCKGKVKSAGGYKWKYKTSL